MRLSSCEVVFLCGCLHVWLTSCEVVFLCIPCPMRLSSFEIVRSSSRDASFFIRSKSLLLKCQSFSWEKVQIPLFQTVSYFINCFTKHGQIYQQGLKSILSMGAPVPGRATFARKVGFILKENQLYFTEIFPGRRPNICAC